MISYWVIRTRISCKRLKVKSSLCACNLKCKYCVFTLWGRSDNWCRIQCTSSSATIFEITQLSDRKGWCIPSTKLFFLSFCIMGSIFEQTFVGSLFSKLSFSCPDTFGGHNNDIIEARVPIFWKLVEQSFEKNYESQNNEEIIYFGWKMPLKCAPTPKTRCPDHVCLNFTTLAYFTK